MCQRSMDVELDRDSNEVPDARPIKTDDDGDIRGSIEEAYDHPPTIVKVGFWLSTFIQERLLRLQVDDELSFVICTGNFVYLLCGCQY